MYNFWLSDVHINYERCYVHNIFTTNHRWLVVIGSNLKLTLHYKQRNLELHFGAAFEKNAASKSCLSCVLHKRSSTSTKATFYVVEAAFVYGRA